MVGGLGAQIIAHGIMAFAHRVIADDRFGLLFRPDAGRFHRHLIGRKRQGLQKLLQDGLAVGAVGWPLRLFHFDKAGSVVALGSFRCRRLGGLGLLGFWQMLAIAVRKILGTAIFFGDALPGLLAFWIDPQNGSMVAPLAIPVALQGVVGILAAVKTRLFSHTFFIAIRSVSFQSFEVA